MTEFRYKLTLELIVTSDTDDYDPAVTPLEGMQLDMKELVENPALVVDMANHEKVAIHGVLLDD